jgi:DNA (cytosine-5)-methyltransferase 1
VDASKELYRRFTPREAARIQSFPDDFEFSGSEADAYRQIGNAVPPVLMWHVANQLVKVLDASQIKHDTQVKLPILVS